jgi:hypothetical protein
LNGSTGAITGTPTSAGSFPFTIQVQDSVGSTFPASFSLTITDYFDFVVADGDSITAGYGATGTLPAGLTLTLGVIGGTPTTAISSTPLTFTVTDSSLPSAQTVTSGLTLTIALGPAPLSITTTSLQSGFTTTSLPSGQVGTPYSQGLFATGGTTPYTWTLTAGTLPDGLTLASGVISGTPTTAINSTPLTFTVTDSSSPPQTATSSGLTLTIGASTLRITTTSLPSGQVGTLYSQGLLATGGTTPYTWTLSATPYTGLLSLSGGPWSIVNDGVTDETLATMVATAPSKIDPLYANNGGANIVVIWGGTNDFIQGATVSDVYNNYVTYCVARHAVGWKVVVPTKLSAIGQDADKNALNALILANSSGCFDAIADFTGTPLGIDGGYANATWFQPDGVHPTQAAINSYEAPIISAAINRLAP